MGESQILQYVGTGFAGIVALMLVKFLMDLVKNHIAHNTKALTAVLEGLQQHLLLRRDDN